MSPTANRYPCLGCGRKTRGNDHPVRDPRGNLVGRICDRMACTASPKAVRAYREAMTRPLEVRAA